MAVYCAEPERAKCGRIFQVACGKDDRDRAAGGDLTERKIRGSFAKSACKGGDFFFRMGLCILERTKGFSVGKYWKMENTSWISSECAI